MGVDSNEATAPIAANEVPEYSEVPVGPDELTLRPAMPKPPNRGAEDDAVTLGAAKLSELISEPIMGDIEMGLGDGIVHDASIGGLDRVFNDNEGNASVGIRPYDALVEAAPAS